MEENSRAHTPPIIIFISGRHKPSHPRRSKITFSMYLLFQSVKYPEQLTNEMTYCAFTSLGGPWINLKNLEITIPVLNMIIGAYFLRNILLNSYGLRPICALCFTLVFHPAKTRPMMVTFWMFCNIHSSITPYPYKLNNIITDLMVC